MKKKILLLGVVLALISMMVVPTQAFAKSNPCKPAIVTGTFDASDVVYISDSGKATQVGMRIITRGEVMQSYLPVQSGWDVLNGAMITVQHASNIKLTPTGPTTGTFSGSAINIINVYPAIGGQLTGVSPTSLTGDYIIDPNFGFIPLDVVDTGSYHVAGQVPSDDGRTLVQSNGTLFAQLAWSGQTLFGNAYFNGSYKTISK